MYSEECGREDSRFILIHHSNICQEDTQTPQQGNQSLRCDSEQWSPAYKTVTHHFQQQMLYYNLWTAAEVHKFRMIFDVMWNIGDCEQQLKKSTTSGWSLMWCETQQTVSSSWRSPQIQVDLWCDVQHSRLWAAAEEVHKLRMISDVMCNTADCEQQLKSRNLGWSLMWCATKMAEKQWNVGICLFYHHYLLIHQKNESQDHPR